MSVADLRAAAVHDDGPQPDRAAAARRPRRTGRASAGSVHGVAAELHDDDLAARTAGCTAAPRRGPAARLGGDGASRRPHVLVDVGVGEVVGEDHVAAVADAEVAARA